MLLAFARAMVSLAHPRMLWVMVWPVLAALAIWLVVSALFWDTAAQWIDAGLRSLGVIQWMLTIAPLAFIVAHLAWVMLIVAFIPLVLVTAVVLIGIFAMPAMVEHVARVSYPGLARLRGGSATGGAWNALVALAVFAVLGLASLPLWVVPLFWPVLPVLLVGYLNQRVYRYDALSEHASRQEMSRILQRYRRELLLLGVIIAVIGHVPIFGFFVPVYGALVFVHYCLHRLEALRAEPIEGVAVALGSEMRP